MTRTRIAALALLLAAAALWWVYPRSLPDDLRPGAPPSESIHDGIGRAHRAYRRASPKRELDRSIAEGDYRPVGLMGIGLYVPGEESLGKYDPQSVKVIPYTTDAIGSSSHRTFQDVARTFAERYNGLLAKKLAERP